VKVAVPPNGYLVSSVYGRGWECGRGFRRLSDFSTWFRQAEGVSPREFRQTPHASNSPV